MKLRARYVPLGKIHAQWYYESQEGTVIAREEMFDEEELKRILATAKYHRENKVLPSTFVECLKGE